MPTEEHDIQTVSDHLPRRWYAIVIATVVLSATVGVWVKSFAWQGNAYAHELSYADDALSADTEVLFIGSSHTFQGVDPRLIEANAANLGYGEANISICKVLLDQHIEELPSLKLVVVQCESWSFELDSIARQDDNYRTLLDQGVSIFDVPLPAIKKLTAIGRTATAVDYPSLTPRQWWGRRLERTQWKGVPGFRPPSLKHDKSNSNRTAKNSLKEEPPNVSFENQFHDLVALISDCKSRGIKVKLIRYPHTRAFEAKIETSSWERAITQLIEDGLITQNDIWDFYNNAIVELDDQKDFADSNHLHPDTIPKFCKVLNGLVEQTLSTHR